MADQGEQPRRSNVDNVCHACGHDGHTVMLLGAAERLARDPGVNGTVCFIFQPAEEGLAGAQAMIDDGLFTRFPCDEVYALHNWPELPSAPRVPVRGRLWPRRIALILRFPAPGPCRSTALNPRYLAGDQ